jgi:hypothetical protein
MLNKTSRGFECSSARRQWPTPRHVTLPTVASTSSDYMCGEGMGSLPQMGPTARHSQRHPHGHTHYETPAPFALGSSIIRPS